MKPLTRLTPEFGGYTGRRPLPHAKRRPIHIGKTNPGKWRSNKPSN
jgi:hypothetical protein